MENKTNKVSYVLAIMIIIFGVYGFVVAISDIIKIVKRLVS
jgi:hypothetical protein